MTWQLKWGLGFNGVKKWCWSIQTGDKLPEHIFIKYVAFLYTYKATEGALTPKSRALLLLWAILI